MAKVFRYTNQAGSLLIVALVVAAALIGFCAVEAAWLRAPDPELRAYGLPDANCWDYICCLAPGLPILLQCAYACLKAYRLARRGFVRIDDVGLRWRGAWGDSAALSWRQVSKVIGGGWLLSVQGTRDGIPQSGTWGADIEGHRELAHLILQRARGHKHIELTQRFATFARATHRGVNITAAVALAGLVAWVLLRPRLEGWAVMGACSGLVILVDLLWRCCQRGEAPLATRLRSRRCGAWLGLPLWLLGLLGLVATLAVGVAAQG